MSKIKEPIVELVKTREEIEEKGKDLLVHSLSPQHRQFVWGVVEGKSASKVYMEVYPKCSTTESAQAAASRLLASVKIKAALQEIEDLIAEENMHRLKGLQQKALSISQDALDDRVSDLQLRAAKDILDRTGLIRRTDIGLTIDTSDRFQRALTGLDTGTENTV